MVRARCSVTPVGAPPHALYTARMQAALMLLLAMAGGSTSWQTIAPGAERLRVEEEGLHVELFRFDLERYRPEVMVLGPERPRAASALRTDLHAVAVVNGGFFDEQWRSLGLRIAGGKTVIGLRPRVDWGVLLIRGTRAQIVHSKEFRPDPVSYTHLTLPTN